MNVLKHEGARANVKVNTVAPVARTRMTEELLGAVADRLDPEAGGPGGGLLLLGGVRRQRGHLVGGRGQREPLLHRAHPRVLQAPRPGGRLSPWKTWPATSTPSGPRPATPCRGRCRTNCRRWPRCCSPERRRPGPGSGASGIVPPMPIDSALRRTTEAWIDADPDPATRAELQALLDAGDEAALADRMGGTLAFGTAGIRGVVEAGSNRMNRAVVIRTTRGLADYLLATRPGSGPVVVGFDGRLSSRTFAEDTVGVLAGGRDPGALLPGGGPHPAGGLRRPGARGHGGGGGHRQPQPAPGQRLQGLRRQRRPDHPPGGRRHRRRHRPGGAGGRGAPGRGRPGRGERAGPAHRAGDGRPLRRRRCWPCARRSPPTAACASSTPRCTAWAVCWRSGCCARPASPTCTWSPSRPSPTGASPRWPSPTRRSRGPSTWPWPSPPG